jgi:fructan beta-fructosidase
VNRLIEPWKRPKLRPALHFSPPQGWLNDPNGLVFHDGWWHLFYQHHPHSLDWGPMHWGHARSRNLTTWEDLPIALEPGPEGAVFSGSAVVDVTNTAGFGRGSLVAIYTLYQPERQAQAIAWSADAVTWTPFDGNPILLPPDGQRDCRDPKVIRFGDTWVMVVAAGDRTWFYRSDDLRQWTKTGEFRDDATGGALWECPDLLRFDVDGETVWMFTVGLAGEAIGIGSGTWYVVGDFDGSTFTPRQAGRWADHGPDFYAAQSWSGTVDRVWIAWMNNWAYASNVPAGASRGTLTTARRLRLLTDENGALVLAQTPVIDVETLGARTICALNEIVALNDADAAVIDVVIPADGTFAAELSTEGGRVHVSVDGNSRYLELERSGPTCDDVHDKFPRQCHVPIPGEGDIDVRIVVDHGSIEVFAARGTCVVTALTDSQVIPAVIRVDGPPTNVLIITRDRAARGDRR